MSAIDLNLFWKPGQLSLSLWSSSEMTRCMTANTVIPKPFPPPFCAAVAPMSLPNHTNKGQESGHPPTGLKIDTNLDWIVPPTTPFNPLLALNSWVQRGVNSGSWSKKGKARERPWTHPSSLYAAAYYLSQTWAQALPVNALGCFFQLMLLGNCYLPTFHLKSEGRGWSRAGDLYHITSTVWKHKG